MGDKRTVRWGEHVFLIETAVRAGQIEFELVSTDDATLPGTGSFEDGGPTRFHIQSQPKHRYAVTRIASNDGDHNPSGVRPSNQDRTPSLDDNSGARVEVGATIKSSGAIEGGQRGEVSLRAVRDGGTVWIALNGDTYRLDLEDVKRGRAGSQLGADEIRAPMTGTVLGLLATVGDTVTAGQPVLVVEAMKMEHTLKAPRDGRIKEVTCAVGEQVEAQSVLVTFTETGGSGREDVP